MKVLIIHNEYQYAGGEDVVVKQDAELLKKYGHEVSFYKRNNEEIKKYSKLQKILLPFTTIFSLKSYREIRQLIRQQKIELVHVHNTLPLISFSCYYAAKHEKVRLVQTIHNFRLVCPNALFFRDGHICEDCVKKGLQEGIKHGCYRQSKMQTVLVVMMLSFHRLLGTFKKPDAYIALTQFNKEKISTIVPSEKIYVKPNFLEFQRPNRMQEQTENETYYVYAARLEQVKGIFVLLEAFKDMPNERLILLGTGPDEEAVKAYIREHNMKNVECKGFTPHEQVIEYISLAKAVIYPSLWYEGFPMTIVESLACGTPVVVSNTPNLSETIRDGVNGYAFKVGNANALKEQIFNFPEINTIKYRELKENAEKTYKEKYTEEIVYQNMNMIYQGDKNIIYKS